MESVQTPAEPTLEAMKAAYDQRGSELLNLFLAREQIENQRNQTNDQFDRGQADVSEKIRVRLPEFFKVMNDIRKATEPAPAQSTSPTPAA